MRDLCTEDIFSQKIVQYVNNCNLNNFVYLTKLLKVRDTNQSQKT